MTALSLSTRDFVCAWPNFVRKRRVFTEPPCPFYSLSASDEVGARPSLPNFVRKRRVFTEPPYPFRSLSAAWLGQTLFEREEYFAWFSKTIEKFPIGILSTRAITKPSSSFFFHFQNDIKENLVSKPREKTIKLYRGRFYSNTFPGHF